MPFDGKIKKQKLLFGLGAICVLLYVMFIFVYIHKSEKGEFMKIATKPTETVSYAGAITNPQILPVKVLLNDNYYVPQTFNNCGPAALSMDLSYYGVNVSQELLADELRPDHNSTGKDDEKSTSPEEIVGQAETYGLIAYYRPAGSIDLLKHLVAAGFPVIVRTLFMPTDKVAHYRVIKGYDDTTGTIIDEDGFQGPNVTYSYDNFLALWKYFNDEYIVLAPPDKQAKVVQIIGADANVFTAWQHAIDNAENNLGENSKDVLAQFNLSVADYYVGNYAQSAESFEVVQSAPALPLDTLWYQPEPIETYYKLGEYNKVFSLSQHIFDSGDPAYPELYVVRGESYIQEKNLAAAKAEFEKALYYNKNLQSAKDALSSIH